MFDWFLYFEVFLDKELYYYGEFFSVNVYVINNFIKIVKKIKVFGRRWGLEGGFWGGCYCIGGFWCDFSLGYFLGWEIY